MSYSSISIIRCNVYLSLFVCSFLYISILAQAVRTSANKAITVFKIEYEEAVFEDQLFFLEVSIKIVDDFRNWD